MTAIENSSGIKLPSSSVGGASSSLGSDVIAGKSVSANTLVQAPKHVDIKVDTEKQRADLQASIEQLNKVLKDGGRALSFSMDEQVGGPVVTVKNAETGVVIRQIPNEVVVRIAHNIEEFKGLLHNEFT